MHEAKSNLSRLVAALEAGEIDEIEIARAGRTVALLVRPAARPARRPGRLAGCIRMAENFEDPLPPDIAGPLGADGPDGR